MMRREKCVPQWLKAGLLPGQVAVSSNVDPKIAHIIAAHYGYQIVTVENPGNDFRSYAAVRKLNILNPEEVAYGAVAFNPTSSDFFNLSDKLLEMARPKMAPEGLTDELFENDFEIEIPCEYQKREKPGFFKSLSKRVGRMPEPEEPVECFCFDEVAAPPPDPEEEADAALEEERREWEDRLAALVVEYVARFHSVPDLSSLEETVRGKLSLRNTGRLSAVTVSGDLRIYLPDYNEMELRMTPLARTLYIFFLCHPEGVYLADIPDYADELADIYLLVKPGADEELARASIADLTRPLSESLQQKLSLTRRAVRRQILTPSLAGHYLITGERGGKYGIDIPAELRRLPAVLRR